MSIIVYGLFVAAWLIASRAGSLSALLKVYLPALLLLPDFFRCVVPGLPHLSFNQAAIIPVFWFAYQRNRHQLKWHPIDILVITFCSVASYSDWSARGFTEAKNLMVAMLTSALLPYYSARMVLSNGQAHLPVGRQIVLLVSIAAVIGFYEFKFAYNPFIATVGIFFPGQGQGWVTTFRHGLPRVAGPYSHAILAGIMLMIALALQIWLHKAQIWEPKFRFWRNMPVLNKAQALTVVLSLGLLMTIARGPWIGAIVAVLLASVAARPDRKKALMTAGIVLAAAGTVGYLILQSYLDIQPGMPMTQSQESALYRKILFEQYLDIAISHAWFGWGMTDWPKVRGMESIDNYFLLLSLQHGLLATACFMGMMIWGAGRGLAAGLRAKVRSAASFQGFAFAGIYLGVLVALGTVYFGEQVMPMFFFVLGWGVSAADAPIPYDDRQQATQTDAVAARTGFKRWIR